MFPKTITKEEILAYPVLKFGGEIIVVDNPKYIDSALALIKKETLLGFDTESKPVFKKGMKNKIALIQLAGRDKAFLFRINKTGLTPSLKYFLERKDIVKVGAGLDDDFLRLKEMGTPINKSSYIDLGKVALEHSFEKTGLRNLAAMIMKKRIVKREQTSNWEAQRLTKSQQIYAATDAWVCREIYLKLKNNGF